MEATSSLINLPAMPKVPAVKFSPGQRAFARMVGVPVTKEPANEVEADLVGDVFNALYRDAEALDAPPVERQANAELLRWAREQAGWEGMAQAAAYNLPAALTAANMMYEFVSTDEAMKSCLDKQAQAAEAEEKAQAAEQLAQAMAAESAPGAEHVQQQAAALRGAADAAQAPGTGCARQGPAQSADEGAAGQGSGEGSRSRAGDGCGSGRLWAGSRFPHARGHPAGDDPHQPHFGENSPDCQARGPPARIGVFCPILPRLGRRHAGWGAVHP